MDPDRWFQDDNFDGPLPDPQDTSWREDGLSWPAFLRAVETALLGFAGATVEETIERVARIVGVRPPLEAAWAGDVPPLEVAQTLANWSADTARVEQNIARLAKTLRLIGQPNADIERLLVPGGDPIAGGALAALVQAGLLDADTARAWLSQSADDES